MNIFKDTIEAGSRALQPDTSIVFIFFILDTGMFAKGSAENHQ